MQVAKTHHIDCSERGADGLYEWYYEYDLFRFVEGDVALVARSYVDSPAEAHLLRVERAEKPCQLSAADLGSPLAIAAIGYLRDCGIRKLQWLSPSGYASI